MFLTVPFWLLFRYRSNGLRVPRTGPILLLPNHTSFLDPIWVSHATFRSASFMTEASVFRTVLGPLIRLMGAFPKKKFVKDRDSMAVVAERYSRGEQVVIFVEGTRTWDGRLQPIGPAVGRMIERLGARVVFARVTSGHLFHPRWARWPRWVPVVMDYSEPRTFEGWSPDDIHAEVVRGLTIDPTVDAPRGSFGFWLAEGLPDYLWACPSCLALGALEVPRRARSELHCTACDAGWTLDVSCRLTPKGGGDTIRVFEAFDRIAAHYDDPEDGDPEPGVYLRDTGQAVAFASGGEEVVGDGEMCLRPDGLQVGDWHRPLADLQALSIGMGNTVRVRVDGVQIVVHPSKYASHLWYHFLERALPGG